MGAAGIKAAGMAIPLSGTNERRSSWQAEVEVDFSPEQPTIVSKANASVWSWKITGFRVNYTIPTATCTN